jgi:Domain of unknown function (DUF4281)
MLTIAQLFDVSNLFVLPFWGLMILLPNWSVTRRIMESVIPFVILASLYIYLLVGTINADNAQALASPSLSDIAHFFSDQRAAATGWTHFLVMDLFVGRWIYGEGQRSGIWTSHSIALCLFAGPIGLLSHLITTAITQVFSSNRPSENNPATPKVQESPE